MPPRTEPRQPLWRAAGPQPARRHDNKDENHQGRGKHPHERQHRYTSDGASADNALERRAIVLKTVPNAGTAEAGRSHKKSAITPTPGSGE